MFDSETGLPMVGFDRSMLSKQSELLFVQYHPLTEQADEILVACLLHSRFDLGVGHCA
jgi:hypothetical protein